jgi:hypothetical protein
MTKFAQGFIFELSNTFMGYVELFAYLFQRVIGVHADPEAYVQYLGFARSQHIQNNLGCTHQAGTGRRFYRRLGIFILNKPVFGAEGYLGFRPWRQCPPG